jgi:RecJ-like exonuclease
MDNKPPGADKDPRAPYNEKFDLVDCDVCDGTGETEDYKECTYCGGEGKLKLYY